MKTLLETHNITEGKNAEKMLNTETTFNSQQFMMNYVLHAADVSTPTRKFKTQIKWTELLFEEFWHQGDTEVKQGLPISFLCDRHTANVS